ncbi:MAG: ABC transporter ATP-binding protein [Roseiflexaceae bacterium]
MISLQHVSFAYNAGREDAIHALHDINLQIGKGELVALLGHNGSGKSTLAKLIAAVHMPTHGSVTVHDTVLSEDTAYNIRRHVGLVFQRPDDQLIANRVIDDVAFGPENLGLPREEIELRVTTALKSLGISDLAYAQISSLSGGERQRVAIAGVLAMQPSCLILDEPTTMIAPPLARNLLKLAHQLRDEHGVSIIHITHFMHEVVDFDRIIVMDGGNVLMDGTPAEIFLRADELRHAGLDVPLVTDLGIQLAHQGLSIAQPVLTPQQLSHALSTLPRTDVGATRPLATEYAQTTNAHPAFIELNDVHFTYMKDTPMQTVGLRGATCHVGRGEIVALLGGTQAGKSTLIECINGLRRPHLGSIRVDGHDIFAKEYDIGSLRERIGIVFQQPETQLFEETVGKDVSFAPRRRNLPAEQSRAIVVECLTAVGLDYQTFRLRYVYALSGGQKRRVAIAGVLAMQPEVLILDEPVAGLDPRGRAELAQLIARLTRERNMTVILVGNTIDELAELADRAIVMHDGRIIVSGSLRELLNDADTLYETGLELSETAEIARVIRRQIPDMPTNLLHIDELYAAIMSRFGTTPGGSHVV